MNRERISYYWFGDMVYTIFWSIINTTVFVIILQLIFHPGKPMLTPLIVLNCFVIPITAIFIGLRPMLALFTIPDTLYVDDRNRIYHSNGTEIKAENITQIEIKQIGSGKSHMLYYEISLNEIPNSLIHRRRKSLIVSEKYDIRYIFRTKANLIEKYKELGIQEEKITWSDYSWKNFWGFRDKFKK